jgi:hypothetical protein
MASELEVQTIRGPSGGANANKVLIPSGQTLDASEGFIPPPGSIVQVVKTGGTNPAYTSTNTTSFVATNLQLDITPKYANSLLKIEASHSYWWSTSGLSGGTYASFTFYRDSTTNIASAHGGVASLEGGLSANNNFNRQTNYIEYDSPNTTNTVNYKVYIKQWAQVTSSLYVIDNANGRNTITITEIAQ